MTVVGAQPQHMVALDKANAVRLARAALKAQIKTGEVKLADVLLDRDRAIYRTWTLMDALQAQHRWGKTRAKRFLAGLRITEQRTLGELTDRQVDEIRVRLLFAAPVEDAS